MCGIAAFSLTASSKQNARELAHALLTQIEARGSHASGFAYSMADGSVGVYKNPKPGSQLPLHELPRRARTVILHTRYATQGSPQDNRNNHPVTSTDNRIALVHNGVISNDGMLRRDLGIDASHGQVDSLVIPSLLAQRGVAGLADLAGYAAIAWIDSQNPDELRIARLKNSPVTFTWLFDGSFVMASTPDLLDKAIESIGKRRGGMFGLSDARQLTVKGGFIMAHDPAPAMTYSWDAWRRHSNATAGGHGTGPVGSEATTPPARRSGWTAPGGSEDKPRVTTTPPAKSNDEVLADLEAWRARRAARDEQDQAMALKALERLPGTTDEFDDDDDAEFEAIIAEMEKREAERENASCTIGQRFIAGEGYFIIDHEGDISHYPTLGDLESHLAWLAKMGRSDYDVFTVPDELNWVNHVRDLGEVTTEGELVSWVDDMAEIDEHESPAVRNLQYIRDGIGKITTLKGA